MPWKCSLQYLIHHTEASQWALLLKGLHSSKALQETNCYKHLREHYLYFMFLFLLPASVIWATRNICKIPEGCQDLEEHSCKSLQHRHYMWRAFEIKWRCEVWLFAHSPPHFSSWVGNLSFSCIPDRCSIHQDELRNGNMRKQENKYLALILRN